jgi:hypothetical protein
MFHTAECSNNPDITVLLYSLFKCIWYFTELPEPPNTSAQRHPDSIITGVPTTVPSNSEDPSSSKNPQQSIQVRGVEVGIVLLVLVVWIAAIALFFNRWGKIRMLLPYQPDYKEQLKVPGSGACAVAAGGPCPGQQHGSSQGCPQVCTFKLVHEAGNLDTSICGCHGRELQPS